MIIDILTGLALGLVNVVLLPWHVWQWTQLETAKERMNAFVLAGQSAELLYMVLALLIAAFVAALLSRRFLVGAVRTLEGLNTGVGRFAAWFVLLLMLQQVAIIVMGQVFRGNSLLFSPLGLNLANEELQWLSGQLKFYNALLIALCSAWTFIEGGHVRVDLIYGSLGRRAQRWVDLLGSLLFMLPATILLWWFSWSLVMNALFSQRPLNIFSDRASWRGVRLETSGTAEFTWVWAFKVLILVFALLLFLQAVAFALRNLWGLLDPAADVESHPKGDLTGEELAALAGEASIVTGGASAVDGVPSRLAADPPPGGYPPLPDTSVMNPRTFGDPPLAPR